MVENGTNQRFSNEATELRLSYRAEFLFDTYLQEIYDSYNIFIVIDNICKKGPL